jgi:toxin FitB
MYLLDTNVLSEPGRPAPDPHVLRWLDASMPVSYVCAPVLCELLFGVGLMANGARKQALAAYVADTRIRFGARHHDFDDLAAADRAVDG